MTIGKKEVSVRRICELIGAKPRLTLELVLLNS